MRSGCGAIARAAALVALGTTTTSALLAKPVKPSGAPGPSTTTKPAHASTPIATLSSIARVKLTVVGNTLVVTHDVNLVRGEWKGDPIDFFVAFGAPGLPRALDAHLLPVADGSLEAEDASLGEAVPTERAPRRPASAHALLGREQMAGVVVHVGASVLGAALAPGDMASLRVRSVVDLGEPDDTGARSAVVRLGASRGAPLKLGRIVVGQGRAGAHGVVARAEARLCGPEADPRPLAVGIVPRRTPSSSADPPIAPILATRHASDDLCVRLWTR